MFCDTDIASILTTLIFVMSQVCLWWDSCLDSYFQCLVGLLFFINIRTWRVSCFSLTLVIILIWLESSPGQPFETKQLFNCLCYICFIVFQIDSKNFLGSKFPIYFKGIFIHVPTTCVIHLNKTLLYPQVLHSSSLLPFIHNLTISRHLQ
jgi:hypothetical protein